MRWMISRTRLAMNDSQMGSQNEKKQFVERKMRFSHDPLLTSAAVSSILVSRIMQRHFAAGDLQVGRGYTVTRLHGQERR